MLSALLPASVATAELYSDPADLQPFPGEEGLYAKSVEKRRREVMTARHCARLALEQLGAPKVAILRGERNAPLWPRGVVGSLTHCDGYRGAAVGYALRCRSIGIDAEPHEPLPDGVLSAISLEPERDWLASTDDSMHWDKLLFCAKEATYKAWFPLTKRWLGFEDAHITFEQTAERTGTFRSRILVPGNALTGPPIVSFDGRWIVTDQHLLTAIVAL